MNEELESNCTPYGCSNCHKRFHVNYFTFFQRLKMLEERKNEVHCKVLTAESRLVGIITRQWKLKCITTIKTCKILWEKGNEDRSILLLLLNWYILLQIILFRFSLVSLLLKKWSLLFLMFQFMFPHVTILKLLPVSAIPVRFHFSKLFTSCFISAIVAVFLLLKFFLIREHESATMPFYRLHGCYNFFIRY